VLKVERVSGGAEPDNPFGGAPSRDREGRKQR